MESCPHIFNLKVQKVEQTCLFELSWGEGQRLASQVNYPATLTQLYKEWECAYLNFYKSEQMRGRAVGGGVANLNIDWHAELVKAETKLMYEFHRWLRSAELYEIRARIAQASQELLTIINPGEEQTIQISLTCTPMEIDRLPWEAWELGSEFASMGAIKIIRTPLNIAANASGSKKSLRGKTRILAILGDDSGLNFEAERKSIKSLEKIAEVKFVGWQPQQTASEVITDIVEAIADERGWDILFFAGHSNETELTGGELGVAPGVSISIKEIAPQLTTARQRGLQVAIFNSCKGLNIAQSLIDLGFSQVVVMREPIHNRVAEDFLVHFLQALGRNLDLYAAVTEAKQYLRMEKSHTYPSAYLVPSLFCHPGADLYQIKPIRWKDKLRQGLPNFTEAAVLTATVLLALLAPVEMLLEDGRILTQAVYRNLTSQIPNDEVPPVALIEIDTESIYRAKLKDSQLLPMDRSYLGKILDNTRKLNAKIVGIDYTFDTPQPGGDEKLGAAVRKAVDENIWLILGAVLEPTREVGTNEAIGINKWDWTLQGYTDAYHYQVEYPAGDCRQACPISYLMALVQSANREIEGLPQPNLNRTTNLRAEFFDAIARKKPTQGRTGAILKNHEFMGIRPLIDFSIPPSQVYTKIPAWQIIENPSNNKFPLIPEQIVLIASGSDERLGTSKNKADYSIAPSATQYWAMQNQSKQRYLTGGEFLAYMTHHFLNRRMVIPIPNLWMIGVAIIFGKTTFFLLKRQPKWTSQHRTQIILAAIAFSSIYGIASLQLYISSAVLLPWLLPTSVFLTYIISATRRKTHV